MQPTNNKTPFNATDYDANVVKAIPYYGLFQDEVLDLVATLHPQPQVWLDTGCGTGRLLDKAVTAFPHTTFVAADPSVAMLSIAQERLAVHTTRIHYTNRPTGPKLMSELAQAPQVITAILCHHYSQPAERQAITQAVYNALAPGGLYITFEIIRPSTTHSLELGLARWKNFQCQQGRSSEKSQAHVDRIDQSVFPITIDEHRALLQDTGFTTVDLIWASRMQAGFYGIKE